MKLTTAILATAAAFLQVSHACIRLDGLHVNEEDGPALKTFTTDSLRGGGDIWAPANKGCNRIPCGMIGNDKPYSDSPRIKVSAAGKGLLIKGELTDGWNGGHVEFELKYGNNPQFPTTPGWPMGDLIIAEDSSIEAWYKTIQLDQSNSYSYNATIQVAYHTHGLEKSHIPGDKWKHLHEEDDDDEAKFYQCIDIEIIDGLDYPADAPAWGLGPMETDTSIDVDALGASPPVESGLSMFWVAFIVLALLILLCLAIMCYLWRSKKGEQDDGQAAFEPVVHPAVEEAPEPVKPQTPPPEREPSEEEAVAQIRYEDEEPVQVEVAKEATPPPLDATGSQGRHFHFRYVEEEV